MTAKKKVKNKRGGGKKTPPSLPNTVKKIYVKNTSNNDIKDAVMKVEGGSTEGLPIGDIPAHSSIIIPGHTVMPDGSITIDVGKDQMDKIMSQTPPGKMKIGPNDLSFKKAGELTEVDDLKFELGRLRTFLTVFNTYVEHEGNLYYVQVDPLNKMVKFLGKGEGPDEEGQKVVDEFKENAGEYSPEGMVR